MTRPLFSRTLWFQTDGGAVETLSQTDLPAKPQSIVVLGEAGMGKTELLAWLGEQPGYLFRTAKQFRNSGSSTARLLDNSTTLVIDALDELSSKNEGDAVDVMLQKLADLGFPRFVMSCRISDWRHVTGSEAIKEQYPDLDPLVIHLQPLDEEDIHGLLTFELNGDAARAAEVIGRLEGSNLAGLMGNPQTLQMIARVVNSGPLPETKAELFERAVEELRREHSNKKLDLQPDSQTALDAAGAAFAALILSGAEAIVYETAEPEEFEIQIAEAAALPGAQELRSVLGSRLFGTAGAPNRLSYWHRSIGEFLGARWLARQANSTMKRKRLLALLHSHDVVPSSLRGLHAWLAFHSADLAADVIAADPSGVIEYGDAWALSPAMARQLLDALERSASESQRFVAGAGTALTLRGIMRPPLAARVSALITSNLVPYGLRVPLIEAVSGSSIAESFRSDLRAIVLAPEAGYSVRWAALEALKYMGGEDWVSTADAALSAGPDGPRMAMGIVKEIGPCEFSDAQIVRSVVRYAQANQRMVMQFNGLAERIPDARLDGILDSLSEQLAALGNRHERAGNHELTDLGYRLIERRLARGPVAAVRVWSWLRNFDEDVGYKRDQRKRVHALIRNNIELRRSVQRLILIDEPGPRTVWQRAFRLTARSSGFAPAEDDIVQLLESLDPQTESSDERWQDLLRLTSHSETDGSAARAAARRFAAGRQGIEDFINQLPLPKTHDWEIKQAREAKKTELAKAARWAKARQDMSKNIDKIRTGTAGHVIDLAYGYLDLYDDLDHDALPFERLTNWVGTEVTQAAIAGFEAFILTNAKPSAQEIAQSHVESMQWNVSRVIVAALAERVRVGAGFSGVSDDRLKAAFIEVRHTRIDDHAKLPELQPAIEQEMSKRGLVEQTLHEWIGLQLEKRLSNVDQLVQMMWSDLDGKRAADIAVQWLTDFPDTAPEPAAQLIDRLIASRRFDELRELANARLTGTVHEELQQIWSAAAFVADFPAQATRLSAAAASDPKLIWAIRRRVYPTGDRQSGVSLSVDQLVWVFNAFRGAFPQRRHPDNGWAGDSNPWDASEFLLSVLSRIAAMTSEGGVAALKALRDAPDDSYTATLKVLFSEQRRKATEERYRSPSLAQVRAIVEAGPPATVVDLQATLVELLAQIQKRVIGDPADPWRGFYGEDDTPFGEERCRDHLLTMLGLRPEGIDLTPEGHMANDKRADISATLNGMRVPIEIKGQWHKDLWHAADTQLDRLYASDYAAEKRGIYLVFWFGAEVPGNKAAIAPGPGRRRPKSAEALRADLISNSRAASEGRVEVVVLNIDQSML